MDFVEPDIKAVAPEIFPEPASLRFVDTRVAEEHVASRTKAISLWPLALVYATADVAWTDRTSPIENPTLSQQVQQLAADTYFPDVKRRNETLASPILDSDLGPKVPPTPILTGEYDTPSLRPPDRRITYPQDLFQRR